MSKSRNLNRKWHSGSQLSRRTLHVENVEKRLLMAGDTDIGGADTGVEGLALSVDFDISPPPMEPVDFFISSDAAVSQCKSDDVTLKRGALVSVSQATDQEIIDALNNGTQVTVLFGRVSGNAQCVDAIMGVTQAGREGSLGPLGLAINGDEIWDEYGSSSSEGSVHLFPIDNGPELFSIGQFWGHMWDLTNRSVGAASDNTSLESFTTEASESQSGMDSDDSRAADATFNQTHLASSDAVFRSLTMEYEKSTIK